MRRICYVSGNRADFGLIERTLQLAKRSGAIEVSLCVTGMHLSTLFGRTVRDIEASGLRIAGRVPVEVDQSTGETMAKAIGYEIVGMTDIFRAERPELVMVLGDRGEMLAGALAAIHLNIPVVHVHGGERSGTVDEPIRHAISKLAHYHFVTTPGARERLIRMGEPPEQIFVTGAPGLDGLQELATRSRAELCAEARFDAGRPVALMVFHAVVQEEAHAGRQAAEILHALRFHRVQILCLMPNADAGGGLIREALQAHAGDPDVRVLAHLQRRDYVSWLAAADVMVGNSSSGIIEAATFSLPVINVGGRQRGRERSGNVADVPPQRQAIEAALAAALKGERPRCHNVYGDGNAGERIVKLLATLPLPPSLLQKSNTY